MIDKALALIKMERIYPGAHSYKLVGIEAAKAQLLAEILKGAKEYDRTYSWSGSQRDIETYSEQAVPTQYLKELFNVKEK